ncbi:cytidine deaminase [Mycobacterium avium subsp. avium 2285 (R)]|nr:cytidine deaminase [Mycobacterium avium subsp. avium 2285 (R)]
MPPGAGRTRRPELLIDHPGGPRRLGELLPDAFGPDQLAAGRD